MHGQKRNGCQLSCNCGDNRQHAHRFFRSLDKSLEPKTSQSSGHWMRHSNQAYRSLLVSRRHSKNDRQRGSNSQKHQTKPKPGLPTFHKPARCNHHRKPHQVNCFHHHVVLPSCNDYIISSVMSKLQELICNFMF